MSAYIDCVLFLPLSYGRPLILAPLSELYGRQIVFFVTYMALAAFNAGTAAAPNIAGLIVMRALAGSFGSSPLTNAGVVIADMFPTKEQGIAMAIFAIAPFLGPSIGPIIAGPLNQLGWWRWVAGLMACCHSKKCDTTLICRQLGLYTLWHLSYGHSMDHHFSFCPRDIRTSYLTSTSRKKLSKLAGDIYASNLDVGKPTKTLGAEFKVALSRPWIPLFTERIVLFMSLYIAIIYVTIYMMFAAFPIVFQRHRGWSLSIGGLTFLGITIGVMLGVCYCIWDARRCVRVSDRAGQHFTGSPPPPAILGSSLLPIGLFWFVWTNSTSIHWSVSIIGSGFFGCRQILVFLSTMHYLVDSCEPLTFSMRLINNLLQTSWMLLACLRLTLFYVLYLAPYPPYLPPVCIIPLEFTGQVQCRHFFL